jgi:hypothetical protein
MYGNPLIDKITPNVSKQRNDMLIKLLIKTSYNDADRMSRELNIPREYFKTILEIRARRYDMARYGTEIKHHT